MRRQDRFFNGDPVRHQYRPEQPNNGSSSGYPGFRVPGAVLKNDIEESKFFTELEFWKIHLSDGSKNKII